jgi:hypothetical protein
MRLACRGIVVGAWVLGTTASLVGAEPPKATIAGGADETGHEYRWTLTNRCKSPIVYVEFPHYHADVFSVPPGWTQRTTYLVNVGVEDRPGICAATAPSGDGIGPGQSGDFSMRITASGANVGKGNVKVRFDDGTETVVADVTLPQPNPTDVKFLPLIGLAVIFVVVVVIREWRRRTSRPAVTEDDSGFPENP